MSMVSLFSCTLVRSPFFRLDKSGFTEDFLVQIAEEVVEGKDLDLSGDDELRSYAGTGTGCWWMRHSTGITRSAEWHFLGSRVSPSSSESLEAVRLGLHVHL